MHAEEHYVDATWYFLILISDGDVVDACSGSNVSARECFWVGLIGLLLFTLGFWGQEFIGFEHRFGLFAQEMMRHGITVFPTTYSQPYADYPSTSIILIWLFSLPFGEVTKLSAIFPTALASASTLALTYLLVGRFSRKWALMAVCFELMTVTFLSEARSISLDQFVTTITVLCFYLVYTASEDARPSRLKWLPLLLVIGFAIRGPMGVVVSSGVVCSYYALTHQWKSLFRFGLMAGLIMIASWVVLLGLAWLEGGRDFVEEVVRMQVSGRITESNKADFYYYFSGGFGNYALSYPFAVLVFAVAAKQFVKPGSDKALALVLLMVGWVLVVMIGLSIPHFKKARYILPAVPAMAILAAYPFVTDKNRVLALIRKIVSILFLVLPGFLLLLVLGAKFYVEKKLPLVQIDFIWMLLLLVGCQIAGIVAFIKAKNIDVCDVTTTMVAVLAFWLLNLLLVEPAELQLHGARDFVKEVESLRSHNAAPLIMYGIAKDAKAIIYMINANKDFQPVFVDRLSDLGEVGYPAYVMIKADESPSVIAGANAPVLLYSGHFYNDTYDVFCINGKTADDLGRL